VTNKARLTQMTAESRSTRIPRPPNKPLRSNRPAYRGLLAFVGTCA
jgi:hypothetical protein